MVRTASVVVRDSVRAGQPSVLLLVGAEPLEPLLAFFREKCMSLSAERGYAQAVGRFVEWLSVRAREFFEHSQRGLLYTAFAHDLRFGTYRGGIDQHGLHWLPASDGNLRRLSRCLLEFSDWLCQRRGAAPLNPIHHQASYADQMAFWRQWDMRKAGSLLAHTKSRHIADVAAMHRKRRPGRRTVHLAGAKAFPPEHITSRANA